MLKLFVYLTCQISLPINDPHLENRSLSQVWVCPQYRLLESCVARWQVRQERRPCWPWTASHMWPCLRWQQNTDLLVISLFSLFSLFMLWTAITEPGGFHHPLSAWVLQIISPLISQKRYFYNQCFYSLWSTEYLFHVLHASFKASWFK